MLRRCIFSFRQLNDIRNPLRLTQTVGYKSQYNVETLYPNSSLDFGTTSINEKSGKSDDFTGYIPVEDLDIKYARSSGAGGQHVNKVNTKVQIRFHVESAKWIPDWVKPNLMEKERSRLTKEGHLLVSSEKTRKQMLNQADALQKVREMVWAAAVKPYTPTQEEIELKEKRQAKAKKEVLREKKRHSLKKQSRRGPSVHGL